MHYGQILKVDSANGIGIRLVFFVSGCRNKCEGCFQPQTHNFHYGKEFTDKTMDYIINELSKPYYDGITIMGGEPMEPENQSTVKELIIKIREKLPDKNIWLYSGLIYEKNLLQGQSHYLPDITDNILNNIDVLVDGPFVLSKRNLCLDYRGSENQRIIDLRATRKSGNITLLTNNNKLNLK